MADIELTRPHSMRLDEARTAVERVAQQLETDLEVDYEWDGDTLLFDGPGAEGTIELDADVIEVLIDLSAFLRPMKSRVKSEAETYLDRSLDDAAS
jgi:putative polyhydroxyalkanoate system protein